MLQGDLMVGGRVSDCDTMGRDHWWLSVRLCGSGT